MRYIFILVLVLRRTYMRDVVWQCRLAQQTRNLSGESLVTIKDSRCFLEQETLHSLRSTGWFQEQIWAWFS